MPKGFAQSAHTRSDLDIVANSKITSRSAKRQVRHARLQNLMRRVRPKLKNSAIGQDDTKIKNYNFQQIKLEMQMGMVIL